MNGLIYLLCMFFVAVFLSVLTVQKKKILEWLNENGSEFVTYFIGWMVLLLFVTLWLAPHLGISVVENCGGVCFGY